MIWLALTVLVVGCAPPDALPNFGNEFEGYAGVVLEPEVGPEHDAGVVLVESVEALPSDEGAGAAAAVAPFVPPPADTLSCCVDLYLCLDYCRPGRVPMLSQALPGRGRSLYCIVDDGQCDDADAGVE